MGAWDYRHSANAGLVFEERPCSLCPYRTEPWWNTNGIVDRPYFVPDPVKEFLGCDYLCFTCIHQIHFEITRTLRACWQTVSPEVVQLAILKLVRQMLVRAISYQTPKAIAAREEEAKWKAHWDKVMAEEEVAELPIRLLPRVRRKEAEHYG